MKKPAAAALLKRPASQAIVPWSGEADPIDEENEETGAGGSENGKHVLDQRLTVSAKIKVAGPRQRRGKTLLEHVAVQFIDAALHQVIIRELR